MYIHVYVYIYIYGYTHYIYIYIYIYIFIIIIMIIYIYMISYIINGEPESQGDFEAGAREARLCTMILYTLMI